MTDNLWDAASAKMDAIVDDKLGDRLSYALDGVNFTTLVGFVLFDVQAPDLDAIDEIMDGRPRIKISKALVPEPRRSHRIRHSKLGDATFRPAGSLPREQGRYWLFDLEKI